MKTFVIALGLILSTVAQAANWLSVGYVPSTGGYLAIDLDSVAIRGGTVVVRQRHLFPDSSHLMALERFDCEHIRSQVLEVATYDRYGNLIKYDQSSTKWLSIIPGSIDDLFRDCACQLRALTLEQVNSQPAPTPAPVPRRTNRQSYDI